jgi:integrase
MSGLTRAAVRKLANGESLSKRGITAEKLPGDVRYTVNIMVDGQRIHRVIGKESDGTTLTQCEQFISQARADARAGRLALPKGRKVPVVFNKAAVDYVVRLEQSGGRNLKAKNGHIKNHLVPFFRTKLLGALTSFDFERYRKHRRDAGASVATVNRELATLSHLLGRANEWGWIERITARPRLQGEGLGRVVRLSHDEYQRLLLAAQASDDPDVWLFIEIGYETGMRHGEILAMRWEAFDPDRRRWWIPRAKWGPRDQPLSERLTELLIRERAMRSDRVGWVFPTARRHSKLGHRTSMDEPFRRAVARAGLDPAQITPHALRHTLCSDHIEAGTDLPTLQKISGHRTLKALMRYVHISSPHIDAALRLRETVRNQAQAASQQANCNTDRSKNIGGDEGTV